MEEKHAFEQYTTTFGVKIQKYHAKNGTLNTGSADLVINIKTGYVSPQFHIVFDDDFTTTSARIINKPPENWDDIFNNHRELTQEEFQFIAGKTFKTPTDHSEGDRKVNNNSYSGHIEG